MKQFAAATLIALFGMSSALAEINSEEQQGFTSSQDLTNLPATAAGPVTSQDDYVFENPEFN